MGSDFKGRKLKAGGIVAHKWDQEAIATETIAIGDILVVSGVTGNFKRVRKADADLVADTSGPLYIATSKGLAGNKMTIANHGVITGVTTGATQGDPVYLSGTAGGFSLTPTSSQRKIGNVAVVGAAGVGKIDFNGSLQAGSSVKAGTAVVAGAVNVTITAATLGGAFGGRPVVATTNTGTTIYVLTAVWSTNDLVITFSASFTGTVSFIIGVA